MLTGKVPFYHISRSETINNILNVTIMLMQVDKQGIIYPESMSAEAKDFIGKLLRKEPSERLKS
jgi:serine/threonine protein kinase